MRVTSPNKSSSSAFCCIQRLFSGSSMQLINTNGIHVSLDALEVRLGPVRCGPRAMFILAGLSMVGKDFMSCFAASAQSPSSKPTGRALKGDRSFHQGIKRPAGEIRGVGSGKCQKSDWRRKATGSNLPGASTGRSTAHATAIIRINDSITWRAQRSKIVLGGKGLRTLFEAFSRA